MTDRAQVQARRLRAHPFERLWVAARRRVEQDPVGWSDSRVSLAEPTEDERAEIAALLGRERRGARVTVPLAELDLALRSGPMGLDLPSWLARVGGPLRDLPAERAARAQRLDDARSALRRSRHGAEPWFDVWLVQLDASGLLARYDSEGQLGAVDSAVAVIDALCGEAVPRMQLAARVLGDPKALEDGPVARLVLTALAAWADDPPPVDADSVRALWERFDVFGDDLASQVLVLGLRPIGDDPLSAWLRCAADEGHPIVLTRRDLTRGLGFDPGEVSACENPTVLHAAAQHLGPASPALLCTNGRPHAAFWALGDQLLRSGCALRYHGDFDPDGLDIAAGVFARLGAVPWRMSAEDYRAGLERAGMKPWRGRLALRAPWDPSLVALMESSGRPVYEEHVLDELIADLSVASR